MKLTSLAVFYTVFNSAFADRKVSTSRNLQSISDDCIAAVGVHEDTGDSEPEFTLACSTPDGMFYPIPVEQDYIKKNFVDGPFEPGSTKIILPPGAMIDVDTEEIVTPEESLQLVKHRPREAPTHRTIGEKSFLVVYVTAIDATTTISKEALGDSVFGYNGDPVNLKSQYGLCSHGKNIVAEAPDRSGLFTDIADGVVNISVSVTPGQGDVAMRNAITDEINSQFGVSSPTQVTDYAMYCLPPGTMSGIAYAFINSWMSVYSDTWCTSVSTQMHEVGHNLGLAHSNEAGEYRDQSGMMGFSYSGSDSPIMCFNAAKSWQLNWYTEKELEISNPLDNYVGPLASRTEDVYDVNVPPMLLKLNTPSSVDYYVFFNKKVDFNSGTVEGGNQVLITQMGGEGVAYASSELVAKLSEGGVWESPPDFGGLSASVTFDATGERADVRACIGPCIIAPTVSPAPSACYTGSCGPDEFDIQVDIFTDQWYWETSWDVKDSDGFNVMTGGNYQARDTLYTVTDCLPSGDYVFKIYDSFGDGICCAWGDGYYKTFVNDEVAFEGGEFASSEERQFSGQSISCEVDSTEPSIAPSSTPTGIDLPCEDSPLNIAGFGVGCDAVASDIATYCVTDDAKSHCPKTCEVCDSFACVDSALPWNLNGNSYTCDMLENLDPEVVSSYCSDFDSLRYTCRDTCNFCG